MRYPPYGVELGCGRTLDFHQCQSFDNGVLVVILPLAAQPVSGAISLLKIGTARGRLVRHVGLNPRPR